jgi:hypothetical protein
MNVKFEKEQTPTEQSGKVYNESWMIMPKGLS